MIKKLLFVVMSISFINAYAVDGLLQKHIEAGKKAYRQYADRNHHLQIKASKGLTAYAVGDTTTFWRWNLSVMPPIWIQESATCRAVGERSYVFVANSQWEISMNQDDVDSVKHYLEDVTLTSSEMGIVEMNSTYFGEIPDEIDGDPRVIFYFSALGSFQGSVFDGYFSSFNQLTEAEAQLSGNHSNECEMLYMSCNPVDASSYSTLSVLAHELQHLIHWGYDPYEETWVDEGCAEFAMVLFGHPDPIVAFPLKPNNNLIKWDRQFSDYVQVMLFFTYVAEHYGGPDFIKQLVADPAHGIAGFNNTLSIFGHDCYFPEIFSIWTLANFIDDINFLNGDFGYHSFNVPTFATEAGYSQFPVERSNSLENCAAHYYYLPVDFTSAKLDFTPNGGYWDVNLIAYEDYTAKDLITVNFDSSFIISQPDSFNLTRLVLAITNKEIGMSSRNYTFSVNNATAVAEFGSEIINHYNINSYPNPFNSKTSIRIKIANDAYTTVAIYNIKGELVEQLVNEKLKRGAYNIIWNAENKISGTYFIRLKTGDSIINKKCLLLK